MKVEEKMAIKVAPYEHQIKAFQFVCYMFGIVEGGGNDDGVLSSMWQDDQEKAKPFKQE